MEYKLSLLAVFSAAFLLCTCLGQAPGIDLTLQLEAAGTDVVLASIGRIEQAGIFPSDNRLLRRVAFAETRDGVDSDTFRAGYNGGIWQVDEDIFNQTQDPPAPPSEPVSQDPSTPLSEPVTQDPPVPPSKPVVQDPPVPSVLGMFTVTQQ